jgi:hypothetical protein
LACVDVEISNMEIYGWGSAGISVENDPDNAQLIRINEFDHVRIHDNFIHHNQHSTNKGALGYGVVVGSKSARAHIYRNVFDFNRHAITAGGTAGGYFAEENLVLKGGGFHGGWWSQFTHILDVHGTDTRCFSPFSWAGCSWPLITKDCWCETGYGGDAAEEIHYDRNSVQYLNDNAIKIRGKPKDRAYILRNVFAQPKMLGHWDWGQDLDAIELYTDENVEIGSGAEHNIINTDTYGEYHSKCDFDGDGIDDLFLATGATWWFSSAGKYPWSFLNLSSTRKKDLRFGYFDDDDRCDVLTESGGSGWWRISSGGTGGWKPLAPLQGGVERGFEAPLKEVEFGRFNPNDRDHRPNVTRRTTHAFWRKPGGAWYVTPLWNPDGWEQVGWSRLPLSKLRFGDFTGDGVTDVLAVRNGHWVISESARTNWRDINSLGDPVEELYIANMDRDDNIDDLIRARRVYPPTYDQNKVIAELIWERSKNGMLPWTEFKTHVFSYTLNDFVNPPRFGFVGRFGAVSGGTLVIDQNRIGHFFSPEVLRPHDATDWESLFPY